MISNQIIQNTIDRIKGIVRVDICVMDIEGKIAATTFEDAVNFEKDVVFFIDSPADSQEVKDVHFIKLYDENQLEFVMLVKGEGEDVYLVTKLVAFQLQNLIVAYKERYDKDNFIKNLLLDNLLLVDIYNRAKKLHIEANARRVVFLIETEGDIEDIERTEYNALEVVRSLFSTRTKDFITAVDERSIILVKELKATEGYNDLYNTAKMILDMLNMEAMTNVHVSYGTIVEELKEVSRSFKEAKMALAVGKIFYTDKSVIAYNNLGIGRLIYQLPIPLCNMFIKESFGGQDIEDFDEETLSTIVKFFENSLNISETARQLYIHRNTLVYRLDKIQKCTGLDIRVFEDAITFKIAIMVSKYMKYMENNIY